MTAEPTGKEQAKTAAPEARQDSSSSAQSHSEFSSEDGAVSEAGEVAPPLPIEPPPLPTEAPPEDDGWDAAWDYSGNCWYFTNRFTGRSQWENPRVPEATATGYGSHISYGYATNTAPGTAPSSGAPGTSSPPRRLYGGYNPAIHGSYDPNADYALEAQREEEEAEAAAAAATAAAAAAAAASLSNPSDDYTTTARFNRFTGRFQDPSINPDNHNDSNKSGRQMNAFFDVDAAANSHNGVSLKAERRNQKVSKKKVKAWKKEKHEKKEQKRRQWLLD